MTSNPSPRVIGARASRNPVLAEKTPRTIYQNKKWTYEPPKAEKIQDKWNYIEDEVGLVSMLGSMTDKVAKEKARIDLYNQKIKQFEDQQQKQQLTIRTGRSTLQDNNNQQQQQQLSSRIETGRSQSTSRLLDSSRIETDRTINSSRSLQPINQSARDKSSLIDFPVTSLKTLQSSHPEILAKLRAERAAKYVESLNNPLYPPEYDHVSARGAFRPGGGTLKYSNTGEFPELRVTHKKKSNSNNINGNNRNTTPEEPLTTDRIKDNLKSLVKILEETDNEIAKQDLKIALSKKVKTYEKKGDYNKRSAREG